MPCQRVLPHLPAASTLRRPLCGWARLFILLPLLLLFCCHCSHCPPPLAQCQDAKRLYKGDGSKSHFSVLKMKLDFKRRDWPSVGYMHQVAVKSVSADSLSRIPQGDVMGSLYICPLSWYDTASGGVVFLELNWQLALWVMKKLNKKIGGSTWVGAVTHHF